MGNYEQLKQSVSDVIKTNGNQEITGSILQNVLLTIISTVGANATFAGIATPTTNPGTPDGPVFWLASESGTYSNFGSIELQDGLSVLMWNGSWRSQQILSIDNEPTAGSDNLVKSGGVAEELALGAVYDVSAKNPTAGANNDGKFESLSALLEDANLDTLIPTSIRNGGMSIKFVQSSGNKYVQYRLMSDSWSINTNDWSFCGDDVLVENSEWIYVLLDAEKRILAGLKSDGSVEWFIGIPTPVKTYIDNALNEIKNGTESTKLDSLNKIIAFLSEFSISDTLKDLFDKKVDKEEGKSLIDKEFANGVHYIENPEFIEAKTDAEGKIIEGIRKNGTKVLNGVEINGAVVSTHQDVFWTNCIIDKDGKVILGLDYKGKLHCDLSLSSLRSFEEYIKDSQKPIISNILSESILQGALISEPKNTLTISGGADYNTNTGDVYVGYMANDVKVGESAGGSYACLSIFNLISPEETKHVYVASYFYNMPTTPSTHEDWLAQYAIAAERNAYFPSYGIVAYCYDTIAKKITTWGRDDQGRRTIASEYIEIITNASTTSESRTIGRGIFARDFNLSTKTFGEDLTLCTLTTPSSQEIEMTDANCVSIVTALDLETPTSEEPQKILINTDPAYFYDENTNTGWYYVFASFGRYTHCVLKSYDLVHYEFVADIPLSFMSEEGQIVVLNNKLYVCCRSSEAGHNSVLLYYDLLNQSWSNKLDLGVWGERPAMSTKDGYLYILIFDNHNSASVDGYRPARTNKKLFKVSQTLQIVSEMKIEPQLGLCYQQLMKIGGNIFVLANCDRRSFAFSPTILSASDSRFVDCRNGLVFSRLQDTLI